MCQFFFLHLHTTQGSVFTNHSQEHSLSFSPSLKDLKVKVTQLLSRGSAYHKLCYTEMLLKKQDNLENKTKGWSDGVVVKH